MYWLATEQSMNHGKYQTSYRETHKQERETVHCFLRLELRHEQSPAVKTRDE